MTRQWATGAATKRPWHWARPAAVACCKVPKHCASWGTKPAASLTVSPSGGGRGAACKPQCAPLARPRASPSAVGMGWRREAQVSELAVATQCVRASRQAGRHSPQYCAPRGNQRMGLAGSCAGESLPQVPSIERPAPIPPGGSRALGPPCIPPHGRQRAGAAAWAGGGGAAQPPAAPGCGAVRARRTQPPSSCAHWVAS